VLAFGGVHLFRALGTGLARNDLGSIATFPRLDAIGIDAPVFVFTLVLSLITGLLFGLAPAVSHSRIDHVDVLHAGSTTTSRGFGLARRLGAQGALVVAEIMMATVLLVCGGLLMHSVLNSNVGLGYDPGRVLTFQVSLPGERHPVRQLKTFADDLVARLRTVPGVQIAAYANQLPIVNLRDTAGGLWRTPDAARRPSPDGPDARLVSRDYLRVLGIRVIAGRGFGADDGANEPRVLLINETLARHDYSSENPLGQAVYGRDPVPWTIVGIVADVRQFGLDHAPEPQFFADLRQWPETGGMATFPVGPYYAIRTATDPASGISALRDIVRQLDPQATLDNVATMDQIVSNSITIPRTYAVLLAVFACVAVGLAAVGIYGVMAYGVTRRAREFGIRIALGAERADVLGLVLRQSMALVVAGIILGLLGAAAVTRYLQGMLFGLTPLDPTTFLATSLMFAAVATLAAYLPARRATNVDPQIALRSE
jgi:putative ABC transport system permease protein